MLRSASLALLFSVITLGCNEPSGGAPAAASGTAAATTAAATAAATGAAPSGGDAPCSAVIDKLASYNPGSGDPEKKLWGKMCDSFDGKTRSCIVASKTLEESQKCLADVKLK